MNLEDNVKQWLSDEDLLREMKYDENADFHYIIEFPKEENSSYYDFPAGYVYKKIYRC